MMKSILTAAVVAVTFQGVVQGAELACPVYPLKTAPAMDGKWGGPAWAEIPAVVGLTSIKTGTFAKTRQTTFKLGWLGDDLYLAVKCEEPEPEKVKFDENNYRDGWYPDDSVEFFFTTDKSSNKGVRQFMTNIRGARWANFTPAADALPWAAAASKGSDHWSAEIKIPFSQLGISGNVKAGKYWFNLARTSHGNAEEDRCSCLADVKAGFGDAANFASLSFKDAPTKEQLAKAEKELNRLDGWLREKLWKIGNVKEAFLADQKENENLKTFMDLKQKAKKILADKTLPGAFELIGEYDKLAGEFAAPVKKLAVVAEKRDAAVRLWLDGKELAPDASGKYQVRFKEGLSVLAAECASSGSAPSVKIQLDGLPETAARWKVSSKDEAGWMDSKFSDEKWEAPKVAEGGMMWSAKPDANKIYMRQVILWESKPFGKNLCINPPVKEWLFSENSTDTLFLSLYPLLPFAPSNFEFVLDLPEGFELLELSKVDSKSWHGGPFKVNARAKSVAKEEIKRDGMNYTRHRLAFDKENVPKDMTFFSMLPVRLNKWASEKKETAFYFHRISDGNFMELEQTLPVGILPPINGRMPKKLMMSQYCGSPYFGGVLSKRHMEESVKDAVAAGMTHWMINSGDASFQKILAEAGAKSVLGHGNHPIWGCKGNKDNLYKILKDTPDTRAQYFNNTLTWEKDGMYCPSWAVGEGRDQFKAAVRDDYALYLKKLSMPTDFVWINWEGFPWVKSDGWSTAKSGDESYCFCPRCKKEFVKYAGLPEGTTLTDDEIFKNHYKKWFNFRSELDGKREGAIKDALAELGKKYIIYSQTQQREFWAACKGNVEYVFLGCPGNGAADSKQQEHMDEAMKFFNDKVGLKSIIGQRFSFFGPFYFGKGRSGPQRFQVMSQDGIVNPKSWKSQILRMAATMHGGLDIQSSLECVSGMLYYFGEATRAISEHEDLFADGKREDSLAQSAQLKYPNMLVLTKDGERLVLLFNENDKPLDVDLENKGLKDGQTATIWEKPGKIENPGKMKVTVPPNDVTLVRIK